MRWITDGYCRHQHSWHRLLLVQHHVPLVVVSQEWSGDIVNCMCLDGGPNIEAIFSLLARCSLVQYPSNSFQILTLQIHVKDRTPSRESVPRFLLFPAVRPLPWPDHTVGCSSVTLPAARSRNGTTLVGCLSALAIYRNHGNPSNPSGDVC